jgi:hypothetical protein
MWLSVFCFCILGSLLLFSIPLKGLLFRVLVTPAIGRAILCI